MARPLDAQCKALYKWEGEWASFNMKTINLKDCRKLVRWCCKAYKVPMPKLYTHPKKRGSSFSCDDPYIIVLNRSHMNIGICLHEAAHTIHSYLMGDVHEGHGPQFLAIYLNLLFRAKVASRKAITLSMKSHGLRWRPLTLLSPTRIRKTYRRVITNKKNQD